METKGLTEGAARGMTSPLKKNRGMCILQTTQVDAMVELRSCGRLCTSFLAVDDLDQSINPGNGCNIGDVVLGLYQEGRV